MTTLTSSPPAVEHETQDQATSFLCAGCGSASARRLFDEPVPRSHGHEPVQCEACSLVAIHPMPTADRLVGFYEDEYYGEQNRKFGALMERAVGWFRRARVRWVTGAGIRKGRVLDLGCARGLFLEQLQRRGFEVAGIELSEHAARTARARLGRDRVHVGSLAKCDFAEESFDAITAWQVFEHLPDPLTVLRTCRRLLRPGGVLILAVPNIASTEAKKSGAKWFHLDVPRHVFHYSPSTLGGLLRSAGYDVERVSHRNLEQNPFGAIQSALHRLGRPFCGLYDALRGKRGPRGRLAATTITAMLLPFSILTSLWSALRGDGATFTVRARRRSRAALRRTRDGARQTPRPLA